MVCQKNTVLAKQQLS